LRKPRGGCIKQVFLKLIKQSLQKMNYQIQSTSFLGTPIQKGKTYTIIGAGISGLMIGFYLKKANIPFKIIEKSNQVGGVLQSQQTNYGLVERAANGFIWCPEIQWLCDELDLEILSPRQEAKARYIVKNRELRKIPFSVLDGFRMAGAFFKTHPQPFITLEDFGNYFFGKKNTQQVVAPAFAGIYGAKLEQLSFPGAMRKIAEGFNQTKYLRSAFKNMRSNGTADEKKKRSAGTHSFKNGMGELTARLAEFLKDDIEFNVDGISQKENTENLIITAPAHQAQYFFDGKIAELLGQVKYSSMISATAFFRKSSIEKFKVGFGCLIPRNEGITILGVLFNSCIFDHRVKNDDLISLTCMIRDDTPEKILINKSDEEFKSLIINDLMKLFGEVSPPEEMVVSRWPNGIPVYSPELYQNWFKLDDLLKENHDNRHLFGNYTGDISIRAMCQASYKMYKNL